MQCKKKWAAVYGKTLYEKAALQMQKGKHIRPSKCKQQSNRVKHKTKHKEKFRILKNYDCMKGSDHRNIRGKQIP